MGALKAKGPHLGGAGRGGAWGLWENSSLKAGGGALPARALGLHSKSTFSAWQLGLMRLRWVRPLGSGQLRAGELQVGCGRIHGWGPSARPLPSGPLPAQPDSRGLGLSCRAGVVGGRRVSLHPIPQAPGTSPSRSVQPDGRMDGQTGHR